MDREHLAPCIFAAVLACAVLAGSISWKVAVDVNGGTLAAPAPLPSATSPPVNITGDAALATFPGIAGSGTPGDPYVIDGLDIDAGGTGSCLRIEATSSHLLINNCTFTGSGYENSGSAGLYLIRCSNIVVTGCVAVNNSGCGMLINFSTACILQGNDISGNNMSAIELRNSMSCAIDGNEVTLNNDNGVLLKNSMFCSVDNNTVTRNNLKAGDGIHLIDSDSSTISGNNASFNRGVGIFLDESDKNKVTRNVASYNRDGIRIGPYSSGNKLIDNVAEGNRDYDIRGDLFIFMELLGIGMEVVVVAFLALSMCRFLYRATKKDIYPIERKMDSGYGLLFLGFVVGYGAFVLNYIGDYLGFGNIFGTYAGSNFLEKNYFIVIFVGIFFALPFLMYVTDKHVLGHKVIFPWIFIGAAIYTSFLRVMESILPVFVADGIAILLLVLGVVRIIWVYVKIARTAEKYSDLWKRSVGFVIGFLLLLLLGLGGNNQFRYYLFVKDLPFDTPGFNLVGPALMILSICLIDFGFLQSKAKQEGERGKDAPMTAVGKASEEKQERFKKFVDMFERPAEITDDEVTYYREQKVCLVCKAKVTRNLYICPGCDALYCTKCSEALAHLENACWSCNAPFDESRPVQKPSAMGKDEPAIGVTSGDAGGKDAGRKAGSPPKKGKVN